MQVVNITEAQNNFKDIFDLVFLDNEEVVIHRSGRENVVVIPFNEYNSIKETNYLLSSKKNREVLLRSLKDARSGKSFEKELIEE